MRIAYSILIYTNRYNNIAKTYMFHKDGIETDSRYAYVWVNIKLRFSYVLLFRNLKNAYI